MDKGRSQYASGCGEMGQASQAGLNGRLRKVDQGGRCPNAIKNSGDIRQVPDIGLHQTEARTPTTRIVEKRMTHIDSDDAKAGAPQRAGILPGPASEVEQKRFLWHLPQDLN